MAALAIEEIFAVSHSNLMQFGVTILELQDKLRISEDKLTQEKANHFNFAQNAWSMELQVEGGNLVLNDVHDGVDKARPNQNNGQMINGSKLSPSTKIKDNEQCKYDKTVGSLREPNQTRPEGYSSIAQTSDFTEESPQGRAAVVEDDDDEDDDDEEEMEGGGFLNYLKSSVRRLPYAKLAIFKGIKKPGYISRANKSLLKNPDKEVKNPNFAPAPLMYPMGKNVVIHISRHGNSCNNIVPDSLVSLASKKQDPSLSDLGVWSLEPRSVVRPLWLNELSERRSRYGAPVYVSCCIRTWQTALLIYKRPGQFLTLIVSPFLKEKGKYSGNMPDSLDFQLRKINGWILRNMNKEDHDTIQICVADTYGRTVVEVYPHDKRGNHREIYSPEHLTFFKTGIQRFCKWVVESTFTLPVPVAFHGLTGEHVQRTLRAEGRPVELGGRMYSRNNKHRKKRSRYYKKAFNLKKTKRFMKKTRRF
jgi:hypothetical protein